MYEGMMRVEVVFVREEERVMEFGDGKTGDGSFVTRLDVDKISHRGMYYNRRVSDEKGEE